MGETSILADRTWPLLSIAAHVRKDVYKWGTSSAEDLVAIYFWYRSISNILIYEFLRM
jgi:hypothetical protein